MDVQLAEGAGPEPWLQVKSRRLTALDGEARKGKEPARKLRDGWPARATRHTNPQQ